MTTRSSRVRVSGPLAGYSVRFDAELKELGYREHPRIGQLQRLARLSRFMLARRLDVYALTGSFVVEFLARQRRCDAGQTGRRPLVEFLIGQGLIEEQFTETSGDELSELLEKYHQMLVHERGLSAESLKVYDRTAALFVKAVGGAEAVPALDAAAVTGFLLEATEGKSIAWSKSMVFGLRSLLRFFFAEGLISLRLDLAVPSVASWRKANLARAVDLHDVKRLVASCDRRTAVGRRDFAILLLLWRLGLPRRRGVGLGPRRHRLARGGDRRSWQGKPTRPPSPARRCRRRHCRLPAAGTAGCRVAGRVRHQVGTYKAP